MSRQGSTRNYSKDNMTTKNVAAQNMTTKNVTTKNVMTQNMAAQGETDNEQDEIQHMDYIYMVNEDKLIIRMNAELDHHLAEEMRQVIDDVIDKRGVTHIVFDFTKVDFMDSAGIGLIMGRYKKVMDKGDITIVGVRESVKRILLISGLHKIVNIYELKGQEA